MTDLTLDFTGVSIPTNASATAEVYEDVGGDGSGSASVTLADGTTFSYDNSASTSLSDGVTSYTLSGFDGKAGNDVLVVIKLSNSDVYSTAVITDDVAVTPG